MTRSRPLACLLLLLAMFLPASLSAQTRAWLDRDRIALDETATLNIETDQAGADAPDWSPLEADFILSAHSSRQQYVLGSGGARSTTLFAVALQPRREGVLTVPPLRVGQARTAPLTLAVAAAAPVRARGTVFIETEADHPSPYVQQAVGYVVRLYYATQLISGQLDQPTPDGAALQRIGGDLQYTREIGGRRYTVVERRYLLIPERSGTLEIPAARFQGRGLGGFLDDFFGDGQRALSAVGPQRSLDVRAVPDAAPQPWLPLRGLELSYMSRPTRARAGDAVEVVVQATADGANATQLPELELRAGDGAQVFAEPPEVDETFDAGRPQVRVVRRFSVVPARAGTLRIEGPELQWWDVGAGRARTARVEPLVLDVAAGSGATAPAAPAVDAVAPAVAGPDGADERWVRVPGVQGEVRPWALATVVFALLWLGTLMWALGHRERRHPAASGADAPAVPMPGAARRRALRQVLDTGDLGEVLAALCASASPPAADADALLARLVDPAQREAVADLQRARWAGGDAGEARAAVRAAFRDGPRWREDPHAEAPLLPPLYPGRAPPA